MQGPAVVTGRKVGGTHHRERGSGQHSLGSDAGAKLLQCAVKDLSRGRHFDEFDQWLDGIRILDACVHYGLLVTASARAGGVSRPRLAGSIQLPRGAGKTRGIHASSMLQRESPSVNSPGG